MTDPEHFSTHEPLVFGTGFEGSSNVEPVEFDLRYLTHLGYTGIKLGNLMEIAAVSGPDAILWIKPAEPEELKNPAFVGGRLELDLASFQLVIEDNPVPIAPREFQLLDFMMKRPNIVFAKETILKRALGISPARGVSPKFVETIVSYARKKMGTSKSGLDYGHLLKTQRGFGYSIEDMNLDELRHMSR